MDSGEAFLKRIKQETNERIVNVTDKQIKEALEEARLMIEASKKEDIQHGKNKIN